MIYITEQSTLPLSGIYTKPGLYRSKPISVEEFKDFVENTDAVSNLKDNRIASIIEAETGVKIGTIEDPFAEINAGDKIVVILFSTTKGKKALNHFKYRLIEYYVSA